MNYENRIVLYLDILGFQQVIDDTIHKDKELPEKTEHLLETLKIMKEEISDINKGTTTKITQFSDTIIVSFKEDDKSEIMNFFRIILRLIVKLINRDILCRGAISYGFLYHDSDFIFGPALNDAYITESTAALYPRVILDQSILDRLKEIFTIDKNLIMDKLVFEVKTADILKVDTDEKLYFDYVEGAFSVFRGKDIEDYFINLRRLIVKGARFTSPNINVKFGWMKNKFNRFKKHFPEIQAEHDLFYPEHIFISKNIDMIK